ncbi:MAG: phosphate ABC transporter ATP-binding protein [Kosmotoga sp.]|jgi:phosphate transport system ATP-binding protein|nr:MAG: phosphate ABC transporter ATP-binding protein [Kosmotoga sp.]
MNDNSLFKINNLNCYYGSKHAIKNVSCSIPKQSITALVGPSGCGKSTFLRALNRMNDLIPEYRQSGSIYLDGENTIKINPVELRKKVGMVFQKPNPFPKSIFENVVFGPKVHGIKKKKRLEKIAEKALKQAALWDEVKDEMKNNALSLSGGQQQRVCIARAISVEPECLLLDEPTSALDPIATQKIERLIEELSENYTIIIVTHNLQQALRISDYLMFFYMGELVEFNITEQIMENPEDKRTNDYLRGVFS